MVWRNSLSGSGPERGTTILQIRSATCPPWPGWESGHGGCQRVVVRHQVTSSERPGEHAAHVLAVVVLAAGLRLVAEDLLVDADVVVVAEVVFDDVVQVDTGRGPAEFSLHGRRRQQDLHDLVVTAPLRLAQGGIAIRVASIHIDPGVDEDPHHLGMPAPDRLEEQRIPIGVPGIHVGPGVHQDARDVGVIPPDRLAEQRVAIGVPGVHVGQPSSASTAGAASRICTISL